MAELERPILNTVAPGADQGVAALEDHQPATVDDVLQLIVDEYYTGCKKYAKALKPDSGDRVFWRDPARLPTEVRGSARCRFGPGRTRLDRDPGDRRAGGSAVIRPRSEEEKRKLLRELMEERFGPLPPQRKRRAEEDEDEKEARTDG